MEFLERAFLFLRMKAESGSLRVIMAASLQGH